MLHHQLAMYFAALPCPPLPLLAFKESDKSQKQKGHCSYDLIAHYLMLAMCADDRQRNKLRKRRQEQCVARLLSALDKTEDVDAAYTHYQRFTADYISAFEQADLGVLFAPLDSVQLRDPVHGVCCEWSAGQDILHDEAAQVTALGYSGTPYRALLQAALDRFRRGRERDAAAEAAKGAKVAVVDTEDVMVHVY